MVRQDRISNRYAKAIFAHLGTGEKVLAITEELSIFLGVLRISAELQQVLTSAACSAENRKNVVEDILKKLSLSDKARKILLVLAEAGRLSSLEGILAALNQQCLEAKGVQSLTVESAIEVKAADKKRVEEKFKKVLGKTVEANYVLNPTLCGGLRVTAGSRTYDGSLSGWLTSLEEKLSGGSHANHTR